MRVNPTMASPGDLPKGKDKNPARYVRGGAHVNPKLPGQVEAPKLNLWTQPTWVPPKAAPVRPGADNHLKIKSVGFRT